jgi:fumarate hydratase subunit alpha
LKRWLLSSQEVAASAARTEAPNPDVAHLERELLEEINKLGIGPLGLGGRVTTLDVHVETYPTHIASIPVAVNIQCHCNRHKQAIL